MRIVRRLARTTVSSTFGAVVVCRDEDDLRSSVPDAYEALFRLPDDAALTPASCSLFSREIAFIRIVSD